MKWLLFVKLLVVVFFSATVPTARADLLIATNSTWRWLKGTNEASNPSSAWRAPAFNDSSWHTGQAPFWYDTQNRISGNTLLSDMRTNYTSIFLRRPFDVSNAAAVASLTLTVLIDDGFILWINGSEVQRYNVYDGAPVYNNGTPTAIDPRWQTYSLTNTADYLITGTNILAAQVFNRNLTSSDFIIDLQLHSTVVDLAPPLVSAVDPPPGSLNDLPQITVTFSEPVQGVDFSDLLLNGVPALSLSGSGDRYVFFVDRPPPGTVQVTWAPETQITDLSGNPFNRTGPGATWSYQITDTSPPTLAARSPLPGITVSSLTQVEVTFSEPVSGLDAADLLINGSPATNLSGSLSGPYIFTLPPPSPGPVSVTWAPTHGITDLASPPNPFAAAGWTFTYDPASLSGNTVRINEFLAGNADGLLDEDDQASDWIELFNFGDQTINLEGWALSDDPSLPAQWVFPSIDLAPGQYLVVFASGKDRRPTSPSAPLHTNFRLGVDGEFLGLFNANSPRAPVSVFSPRYPEQRTDVSFGYDPSGDLRFFTIPTPGGPNGSSTVSGVVSPVLFNVSRGVFNHPFMLVLGTTNSNALIRYTLNGSEPTLANGITYQQPFSINTTRAVRAAAFASGQLPSKPVTHTYIFPQHVLTQPNSPLGFPTTWGSWTAVDYEMDPEVVNDLRFRSNVLNSLQSFPTLSVVMSVEDMFGLEGIYSNPTRQAPNFPVSTVEKPCSAELIHPDGTQGFQVDCGIRIQGGASRTPGNNPKHSLRLLFKTDYGPGKLDFPFFSNSPVTGFDSLILRGEYNNSWIHWDVAQRLRGSNVRDQWGRGTQLAMSGLGSHGNYVHLYINGLYWGLFNPSERVDASFAASYLGGEKAEYDAVKQPVTARDGDLTAWNAMMAIVRGGLTNNPPYESLQQFLDIPHFADYMILNIFAGNEDWPHNNWAAIRRRVPGARFKFVCWDIERILENPTKTREFTVSNLNSPAEIYAALRNNAEFRLLFADRLHRHFFNNGALTVAANTNRYLTLAAGLTQAVQAESARWGDYRRDVHVRGEAYLFNYLDHWLPEVARLTTNYFPQRSSFVLNQFQNIGLYPSVAAPAFNQHGGRVPANFALTIAAPARTIYYTTNGADPRVYGTGSISAAARLYQTPLALNSSVLVKARVLSGTNWSALTEAEFQVAQLGVPLRISEIMYNPLPGGTAGEAYEFVELLNTGATVLDLSGFSLVGVSFVFPAGSTLSPGATFVICSDKNPANFAARYPAVTVSGFFSGNLSNGGERLALLDSQGNTIVSVDYDDENGWPTAPDGFGPSLEIIDSHGDPDDPANWRASPILHGTPGLLSPPALLPMVRLNEFMAENAGAVTNAGTFPDWVELHNPGSTQVLLDNWSLTDDANPRRFVFPPGTSIPANGYLLVWLDSATSLPGLHAGFALTRSGESLFLFDANTNRVDAVTFGTQLSNYSLGRVDDSWRLCLPSPLDANNPAPVANAADLVLNEWLADSPPGAEDWVELYNRNQALPVPLQGIYLSTSNALHRIGSLSFIGPGAHFRLWADELPGPDHLDFKLPAAGGTIALHDSSGSEIDRVYYGPQLEGISEGRLPDAALAILAFPGTATPGSSNYVLEYTGPILNEVLARNQTAIAHPYGGFADWVELRNPASTNLDLSGMSLSIDSLSPGQWPFPPGTTIPANGFLLVWCDNSRPASLVPEPALNTGRALNGNGGSVYLFNTLGQPVDSVEFGFQVPDLSIGRSGDSWHLLATPTAGEPNSVPAALGPVSGLKINEWMARPTGGDDWFELFNPAPQPVDLGGLFLTDDPSIFGQRRFQAPPLSFIPPLGFVQWIASGSPGRGQDHVNFSLAADGEMIGLYSPDLVLIDAVYFGFQIDGVAQGRIPDGGMQVTTLPVPTPGRSNFLPLHVVINEVLAHTDPPLEDAIELHNLTGTNVAIGGWFLSQNPATLKMYRIPPGTTLPPHGFRVFFEADFNGGSGSLLPFALNSARGDSVVLSAADDSGNLTGYRDEVAFGPTANGVSLGRHLTSVGVDFAPLSARSFGRDNPATLAEFRLGSGQTNAAPQVGPVVIHEVMYHPLVDLETGTNLVSAEFVELHNLSDQAVPLLDPQHPSNTWAFLEGITYAFPTNTVLPPHAYLLLAGFDPATNAAALSAFRHHYSVPDTVPIHGPFAGRLDNTGETLALFQPDPPETSGPDAGLVPMVLVERIRYSHLAPWPGGAANGAGASLQRITPNTYGNDPVHWQAATPAAGRANLPVDLDSDNDALPDWWELAHELNPLDPADAPLDSDGDGMTNRSEFLAGTNPRNPTSSLAFADVSLDPATGRTRLSFTAWPGRTFILEHSDHLPADTWQKLLDIPLDWTTRLLQFTDPALSDQRYYRLRTIPYGGKPIVYQFILNQ